MYESYFHLRKKPFDLMPNPDFLYPSRAHRKVSMYLDYGLKERMSFILLTGNIGSGKTTLIRELIKKLPGTVTLSRVFNTKVDARQLISLINEDFGLDSSGKDKVILLKELYQFLIEEYGKGHRPLLIIDEAQNLTPEVLEEVRMLSNLETNDAKLLQIILVGQPELGKTIELPELEQLKQRISVKCDLSPLSRSETEEYIGHRLHVAGNRDALVFSDDSLDEIFRFSGGVPRLINMICSFLLLAAFTEDTRVIDQEMVADIANDLRLDLNIRDVSKERPVPKKSTGPRVLTDHEDESRTADRLDITSESKAPVPEREGRTCIGNIFSNDAAAAISPDEPYVVEKETEAAVRYTAPLHSEEHGEKYNEFRYPGWMAGFFRRLFGWG